MLNIVKTIENESVLISLEGRLDATTAPELEAEIKSSVDGTASLTLDMEKLERISSAGLRVLLAAQKIMNQRGKMKVVHVGEQIMDIFEDTGFSEILTIE